MKRGLAVWLLIMLIETAHGMLRGLFLAPYVGEETASRIGWPIGLALVFLVSVLTIRWIGVTGAAPLARLGALWAVLTAGFELLIGVLRGLDASQLLAALDPRTGSIPYSAAVMLLTPLAADWLRRRTG
ncbi:MAG: hypothetical protein ACKOED_14900 [Aestuariivirga sp.]|uniref:hypothetical protein n=1 Tax=Aestuariivirga sp. TaxID=2650926 RepID=UPI0038D1092D